MPKIIKPKDGEILKKTSGKTKKTFFKEKNRSEGENSVRKSKFLDFLTGFFISLIFFLTPIYFSGFAFSGFAFEKIMIFYLLTLLALVSWVLGGVLRGDLKIKRTPLDLALIGLLITISVSTFFGVGLKDSLIGYGGSYSSGLVFILFSMAFFYVLVNNSTQKSLKFYLLSFVLSLSFLSVFSLAQFFGFFLLPFDFAKQKTFSPVGSVFDLVFVFSICLPLFSVLVASFDSIYSGFGKFFTIFGKVFFSIILLIVFVNLAVLNIQVSWWILLFGICFALMFFLSKIISTSGKSSFALFFGFIFIIFFLVLKNFAFVDLNIPDTVNLSHKGSWSIAKNAVMANPFLGSGPATFYYDFSKFKSDNFNDTLLWNARFDRPSSWVFESLATVGSLGTLALIVVFLILFSISFLSVLRGSKEDEKAFILIIFSSFITAFLLITFFVASDVKIFFTMLLGAFLAASSVVFYPEKFSFINLSFKTSPKYALALSAVFLAVSAGVVALLAMGGRMYVADIMIGRAATEKNTQIRIEKILKAVSLFPYNEVYYLGLSDNYVSMAGQSSQEETEEFAQYLRMALNSQRQALELAPNRASLIESVASSYERVSPYMRGASEWARKYYENLKELDPLNPVADIRLAMLDSMEADKIEDKQEKNYYLDEALKNYENAISKKGDLAAAYYGQALIYEKKGERDKAVEQMKTALSFNRSFDYQYELARLYFNKGIAEGQIAQSDPAGTMEEEIDPENEAGDEDEEDLSVEGDLSGREGIKNEDIKTAEALFYQLKSAEPQNVNVLYSLALLHNKFGEYDMARDNLNELLPLLGGEAKKKVEEQFSDIL